MITVDEVNEDYFTCQGCYRSPEENNVVLSLINVHFTRAGMTHSGTSWKLCEDCQNELVEKLGYDIQK